MPLHDKNFWKPNSEPQRTFLSLPFDIKEALYGGAAGGGKTEALLFLPIVSHVFVDNHGKLVPPSFATQYPDLCRRVHFYEHPDFRGIFFRRTFPQLEQSIIPRAREIYEDLFGAKYNEAKHFFTFPSGAIQFLSYLNSDEDARKHDTAEYNLITFEELTHFEEYHYLRLISRRRSSSVLPSITRAAATPGGIGHTWVKERFISPDRLGRKIIYEENTPSQKRIFIPARAYDNVDLLRNTPDYLEQLKLLPEAEAKALIEGDWDAFSGQVFTEFRAKPYPTEPPNAIHVIDDESVQIEYWWPKIIAIDWGFTHNTAVVWLAISPDERIYVYREILVSKQYISQWTADMRRSMQYDGNILDIIIDPSANQNRGQPKTIKQQVVEDLEYPVADADNDRLGGKMVIHEYLRWTQRPATFTPKEGYNDEIAQRILRVHGLKPYKDYCQSFQPRPDETNIPRLQILRSCVHSIAAIQNASYDEKKPEDVLKYDGDDMYDALRYALKRVHLYFDQSKQNEDRYGTLSYIMKMFGERQDYNYLAGALRNYNEKISSEYQAVTRASKRIRGPQEGTRYH